MRMMQHCDLLCYGLEAPLWSCNELFFLPQQHRKSESKSSVCSKWITLSALSLGCCHNEELCCEQHVAVLLCVHSNACTHSNKVAASKKRHTLTRTRRAQAQRCMRNSSTVNTSSSAQTFSQGQLTNITALAT